MILSQTFDSSSSSAKYAAQFDTATGKGTCNCPGWTKRAVRECKHTKLLAADDRNGGAAGIVGRVDLHKAALDYATRAGDVDALVAAVYGPDLKPMLASAMKEDQTLDDFTGPEWIMEEKYDGHRLLIYVDDKLTRPTHPNKVTAWSRPGHDRPAAQRALPALLERELGKLPSGVYDGELCIPGGTSSDVVRLDRQNDLVIYLFDVLRYQGESMMGAQLYARRIALEWAHRAIDNKALVRIAGQTPVMLSSVQYLWAHGGEGAVLKRLSSLYRSGWRTPDWIKVKQIAAAEFTITGFEEGKNGPCSVFKLRHDDGRETSCKVLTNAILNAVHANPKKYIGQRITISYMGFTKSGLWRHPVFDHFNA
jgi:ATP-dependent DNA ligase